jgi:ferritin-like metal-binding protein YciE
MMSYFEPNPAKADSVAADDVRETESSPPAEPEEPSERADSLSIFPSEGSEIAVTDLSSPNPADVTSRAPASEEHTVAGTRNPRTRLWYSAPVGIADDRAKLEAKLGTYVETVATLQAVCTGIERRLGQVEDTLARTEGLSTRIAARLSETQDALQHIESVGTSGPSAEPLALQALGANIDKRLAHVEEALGRTEALVADRTLHEVSAHIAARLTETEGAVRRIESVVASGPPEELFALQTLSANIDKRLAHVEEALGRTEALVTDRTLHVASAHIVARLTETEGAVRRIESLVASGAVAELSARVDAAFAHTDDALRRIEAALENRSEVPSINRGGAGVREEEERQTRPARVAALAPPRPSQAPWRLNPSLVVRKLPGAERIARLAAVIVVLVGVLIFVAPMRVPINVATPPPPPREEQQLAVTVVEPEPLAQAPQEKPNPPTSPSAQPTIRGASAPAPRRRADAGTTADATAPPAAPVRFVGDLSITSIPRGARVLVNGRAVGVTPLTLREQRAGSVAVQIASEGFERWTASVQIPAGRVTNIAATLRASRP